MLQKIEPECAEELSQVVAPWQLTLRQLSAGTLRSCISFTAIDDILVTNDRWQGCIHGFGGTAANYFTIIGAVDIFQIPWNGTVLDENTLACAAGNVEWEFVTPHGTNHWVVMIPAQRLADYMGVEPLQVLGRESLLLRCDPGRFQRFSALANRCLRRHRQAGGIAVPTGTGTQLKAEMMDLVAEFLSDIPGNGASISARTRYTAYRKALNHARNSHYTLAIPDLAAATGVSVRELQRAFREHLGYSPYRYLRLCRLNRLHEALRESRRPEAKVTQLMEQFGFTEFGRNAGEYRRLFGESPSKTLARPHQVTQQSVIDSIGA